MGRCWIIQVGCTGGIATMGTAIVYFVLKGTDTYGDPDSEWYIQDKTPILVVAGLISFIIGHAFMNVFDMTTDTILYCKCIEEGRRKNGAIDPSAQYAPDSLDRLIREEY